ncbi:hypothetical protein C8F04DRAFT_1170921 [Mycena alexandri]|uniref:Uncharacterized protein n=1 Tax=Mycena alexandri TaxID=1745969 RepID=A0AAD6RWN5_9AGAR|nr:hypothetical protein C8F04DRAFT_1170921 [Mycena alexandri]
MVKSVLVHRRLLTSAASAAPSVPTRRRHGYRPRPHAWLMVAKSSAPSAASCSATPFQLHPHLHAHLPPTCARAHLLWMHTLSRTPW